MRPWTPVKKMRAKFGADDIGVQDIIGEEVVGFMAGPYGHVTSQQAAHTVIRLYSTPLLWSLY